MLNKNKLTLWSQIKFLTVDLCDENNILKVQQHQSAKKAQPSMSLMFLPYYDVYGDLLERFSDASA